MKFPNVMPTPDQIEVVARAIEDAIDEQDSRVVLDDMPAIAHAAIAAYEATRPAVPSDEELLEIFFDNSYPGSANNDMEPKEVYTDHLAGIRAVRDRLEGEK
jgi:hypothetical protein